MASTYDGTAADECLTRAAVVDGVANGDLFWSGSAPWSASGRLVTWAEFNDYVDLWPGAPDTNRCPAKADLEEYRDTHTAPSETPGTPSLGVQAGGSELTATWLNTSSRWGIDVEFECSPEITASATVTRPAGSTAASYDPSLTNPPPFGGQNFRARVRYTNAYGAGDWSGWSNIVSGVTW